MPTNAKLVNALESADGDDCQSVDPFNWFNIGTNFSGWDVPEAHCLRSGATSRLPWRMNWYQFGMFESYLNVGAMTM
jgi:hypothetical protein